MEGKTLIRLNGITATSEMVGENPHMPDWRDAYHYKVTLKGRFDGARRQLTVFYSMGYAHSREPEAADVLECLCADASTVDNCHDFEDWAADLGYDSDSRKAERTFKAVEKQAEQLRRFLGDEYRRFLAAEW